MRLPYVVEVQERREKVPDENGAVSFSWATVDRRHAQIKPLKSSERVSATAVQGIRSHTVTMRNGGRIVKSNDRIVKSDQIFEVDGPPLVDFERPGWQAATVVEIAS